MSEPQIFFVGSEYVDVIADIWLESTIAAHAFIPASYWQSKLDQMKSVWLPSSESWGIQQGGNVSGFYSLVDDRLAALFLRPSDQGKGFGTILIKHAKSQRIRLELTVYKKNTAAIHFYVKCGFHFQNSRIDEGTGEVEQVMVFPCTTKPI